MYCSECGNAVNSTDNFCSNCGTKLSATEKQELAIASVDTQEPYYIELYNPTHTGPWEESDSFWSGPSVTTGFVVYFKLLDTEDHPIATDGELTIALVYHEEAPKRGEWEREQSKAKQKAFYFKQVQYKKSDMYDFEFGGGTVLRNAYEYRHVNPPIKAKRLVTKYVHLWFKFDNGKVIYGQGSIHLG